MQYASDMFSINDGFRWSIGSACMVCGMYYLNHSNSKRFQKIVMSAFFFLYDVNYFRDVLMQELLLLIITKKNGVA